MDWCGLRALVSNCNIEGVMRLGTIQSRIYAFGRLLSEEGLLDVDDTSSADALWSKSCKGRMRSLHEVNIQFTGSMKPPFGCFGP